MTATAAALAHVRAAFDEFNARLGQLRTEDGLRAYHGDFFTPDMVIDNVEHFPVPTQYVGFEGYRHWFAESLAPYDDLRWTVESNVALGDRVLTLARISGRQPGDPTLLEVRLALVYTLRGDRICRIEVYLSEKAARAAADIPT